MTEENISQEFSLKEIDKTRNRFIEEIKGNELKCKKHKKFHKFLNYNEQLLILASTVTGCVSISPFAPLAGIPVGIASSATTIKTCAITTGIKKLKSIIKKKKKKYDKIVLLVKTKLNLIEVLISKASINISYDKFVSVNNVEK